MKKWIEEGGVKAGGDECKEGDGNLLACQWCFKCLSPPVCTSTEKKMENKRC